MQDKYYSQKLHSKRTKYSNELKLPAIISNSNLNPIHSKIPICRTASNFHYPQLFLSHIPSFIALVHLKYHHYYHDLKLLSGTSFIRDVVNVFQHDLTDNQRNFNTNIALYAYKTFS